MTTMLADAVDRGTGSDVRAAGYRGPMAGKTGTTDDYRAIHAEEFPWGLRFAAVYAQKKFYANEGTSLARPHSPPLRVFQGVFSRELSRAASTPELPQNIEVLPSP